MMPLLLFDGFIVACCFYFLFKSCFRFRFLLVRLSILISLAYARETRIEAVILFFAVFHLPVSLFYLLDFILLSLKFLILFILFI